MKLLSLTLCVLILIVRKTDGATYPLPDGNVWYVKATGTYTFKDAEKKCESLKGKQISITNIGVKEEIFHFLEANPGAGKDIERDVWLNAAKIKGKYYWEGDEKNPVKDDIVKFDDSVTCDDECCNLRLSLSKKLLQPIKCDDKDWKARALCFLEPMSQIKENVEKLDLKIEQEHDSRNILYDAILDMRNSTETQQEKLDSMAKEKTTLYILWSLTLVSVLALAIFNFITWRRIH